MSDVASFVTYPVPRMSVREDGIRRGGFADNSVLLAAGGLVVTAPAVMIAAVILAVLLVGWQAIRFGWRPGQRSQRLDAVRGRSDSPTRKRRV